MKENVYRVENEPAGQQVEDANPAYVAALQLLKRAKVNCPVMGVHGLRRERRLVVRVAGRVLNCRGRADRRAIIASLDKVLAARVRGAQVPRSA